MPPKSRKPADTPAKKAPSSSAAAKKASAAAASVKQDPGARSSGSVACAEFKWTGGAGGIVRPIWQATQGRGAKTMIDFQKGRNNYYNMDVRQQAAMCRRMSERNWFLRPVKDLRHASWCEDFDARNSQGESMSDQYDFASLVSDVMHERLTTSNVVCMWRKREALPFVTVMDMEQVEYRNTGGLERIRIEYSQDQELAANRKNEAELRKKLGDKMYEAMTKGGTLEIIKGMDDAEWDFEVMISGKRRGVFCIPEMVPILDSVDFVELMGIGDWNLAWARKDVIRLIKKGYPVTHGQGAGINSVDITDDEIADLGKGFAEVNGNTTIPANHDVNPSYLLVPPDGFDPKQMDVAWNKLLTYGGIEAVVLFGSFSQQNGAAPSLMRNARTMAFKVRKDVEDLLNRIFSAPEFSRLDWGASATKGSGGENAAKPKRSYFWGVKSLYSMDELLKLVDSTDNGISSRTTAREMLGLNDKIEGDRLEREHAERKRYAPCFESSQALLPAMFPEELGSADSTPASTGDPGRPAETQT